MAKKKTRSEEESYRLVFFIIANLIALSMVWLVYQEFFSRRPWKDWQLGWFEVEKERAVTNLRAEQEWLKSGTLVKVVDGEEEEIDVGERVTELTKAIAELEGEIIDTDKRVEFEDLKKQLAAAEIRVKEEEIKLAFAKAYEDEYYYYYRHAKHSGHDDHVEEYEAEYEKRHAVVLEASRAYDKATAKRDLILDKVTTIQAGLIAKKAELAELQGGLAGAQRAVDVTAERWTGIEQFWNQEIELVDRCQTCHMGFDKCGFTDPEEILAYAVETKTTEKDLRRRYCVTRAEAAAYLTAAEEVRDSWFEDEKIGYEDVKDRLLTAAGAAAKEGEEPVITEPVLASAAKLGIKGDVAEALYRTHPKTWELMRAHPPQTYGCTTCHYGQGRQTKGTGLNYLAAWLWKGDIFMAPFDHATGDHYWEAQILDVKRNHTEASCFNCHEQDYELEFAPHLTEGRKLVQHLGCTGCHPMGVLDPERKHGPTLTKITSKATDGWTYEWIKNPHAIRPRTRMPNFWPSAVGKDGKPDLARKDCAKFDYERAAPQAPAVWVNCYEQREEEAAYILAYLEEKASDDTQYPAMPAWASAEKGQELFEGIGCRGCHNLGEWTQASHMPGSTDRDLAPNLDGIGDKIKQPGWVYEWVRDPKSYWHETRMPSLRLTEEEAWHVSAYLTGLSAGAKPTVSEKAKAAMGQDGATDRGKTLIGYYGCFGCHEISGFEGASRIGADLTSFGDKKRDKLDFGDVAELVADPHAQTWEAWTRLKLLQPRAYTYERAVTKMPKFNVSDDELNAAIIFLKSQNERTLHYPEHVKHTQDERDRAIQRGEYLLDVLNCSGCHLIDKQGIDVDGDHRLDGGDIYRLYAGTDEAFRAPPKLIRQGAKVYPDWFFNFLKEPFKLRENFVLRMPTFQLSDETAKELVAYFAAKAGQPYPFLEKKQDQLSAEDVALSDRVFKEAQCLNCHNLGGGGATDPKNVAPNLRLTAGRLQYDWLFDWLKDPQSQAPGVGMPGFFFALEDGTGEFGTPLDDLADGDWRKQIVLLRAYVISLGLEAPSQGQKAANDDAPKKKRKRG